MLGFIRQAYAKAAQSGTYAFESHFDGSTAIHRRNIDIPELAQTPPMRKLSEEF